MDNDIQYFENLLKIQREKLRTLMLQREGHGSLYVPAKIEIQITETKQLITDAKRQLRNLGRLVEDLIIDPEESKLGATPAANPSNAYSPAPTPSFSIGTINAQNVNTGTQHIDTLNLHQGDNYNLSGTFNNTILNLKATLNNVTQQINALPSTTAQQDTVKQLAEEFLAQLQQADQQQHHELITQASRRLQKLLDEYQKSQPDRYELTVRNPPQATPL